jgi:hypothetical protein
VSHAVTPEPSLVLLAYRRWKEPMTAVTTIALLASSPLAAALTACGT